MSQEPLYEVKRVLSPDAFRLTLANFLRLHDENVAQRDPAETQIFGYMNRYLCTEENSIKALTIVCEHSYTCLNYLEDFANYYSRTYTDYKKKCKRLHFFSKGFKKQDFEKMILNPKDELWKSYQGCIVVKPIPRGTIGVTYLNTYDHSETEGRGRGKFKERHYKCLTTHKINLFGRELSITTMPFKEQDGAVASCATTALWMAFQKTAEIFNSTAPSLSEITILAGGEEDGTGRIFPSKGLSTFQVLTAISKLKMTPLIEEFFDHATYFKCALHAYLKGDIPILLGLEGIEGERNTFNHLVTANGYRYTIDKYRIDSSRQLQLLSDRIAVFYVNDDQIGPFARTIIRTNDKTGKIEIETSWKKREKGDYTNKNIVASPGFIVVPLSSSIRVPFRDIYLCYLAISQLFTSFISQNFKKRNKTSYDIYITRSNLYKKERISEKESIYDNWEHLTRKRKDEKMKAIVTTSLPKYIWVIEAREDNSGKLLFDYIYDTVEMKYDSTPVAINIFHNDINKMLESYDETFQSSFNVNHHDFRNSILRDLIAAVRSNSKRMILEPFNEESDKSITEETADNKPTTDVSDKKDSSLSVATETLDKKHFMEPLQKRRPIVIDSKITIPHRHPTEEADH